jgi:uncharacterized membrane protein
MRIRSVLIGLCTLAAASGVSAQTFDLTGAPAGEGTRVYALSADGRVATGWSSPSGTSFLWTRAGGRQDLPTVAGSSAAISGDGTTIAGRAAGGVAFRYAGPGTYQPLPAPTGFANNQADGVSGDGSVVVGTGQSGSSSAMAWRWTDGTGTQALGRTRPGHSASFAQAVSRDGQTIVGWSGGGGAASEAWRWSAGAGMQALADHPGATASAVASAITGDGSAIAGRSGLLGSPPAVWRGNELPTILPTVSGWGGLLPHGISDDGTVVAGEGTNPNVEQEAWIWTPTRGSESLFSYLTSQGVSVPTGWRLASCTGMSADGRTFAGYAFNASQIREVGFVTTVPTPGALVTVCAAFLVTSKRKRRAAAT